MNRPVLASLRSWSTSTFYRTLAAVLVVSLVAITVVALATRPDPVVRGPGELAVNAAATFIAEVSTSDPDARARAIGRWVTPNQVPQFVDAYDKTFADRQNARVTVVAEPRGYKTEPWSRKVMEVLVWSRVTQSGGRPSVSWEISALGMMAVGDRWQVFSYDGSVYGVAPGDKRLAGFVELIPG